MRSFRLHLACLVTFNVSPMALALHQAEGESHAAENSYICHPRFSHISLAAIPLSRPVGVFSKGFAEGGSENRFVTHAGVEFSDFRGRHI